MANLTRGVWVKYIPTLGDNKTQPAPFYLRVKSQLTKVEHAEFHERMRAGKVDDVASLLAVFGPVVQMGDEPSSIDGAPLTSLEGYLGLVAEENGGGLYMELLGAVAHFNGVSGNSALFSERLSGGTAFTAGTTGQAASTGGSGTKH